ncbi:MAG: hypothetical protein M1812_007862 [Candelaria pacifica]|nr:MAG: hypothetical protein M1812_007862 [Candelaria pacifica]
MRYVGKNGKGIEGALWRAHHNILASWLRLQKKQLDPELVESLKEEVQKMAGDKGWKLEVVDAHGVREMRGIVDGEEDEEVGKGEREGEGEAEGGDEEEGSVEVFREDL